MTGNWEDVNRWFTSPDSPSEERRSWRGVIDALGALGRGTQRLRDEVPTASDPELDARIAEVVALIDDVATRLASAIGDARPVDVKAITSPVLALDERARRLEEHIAAAAERIESITSDASDLERALQSAARVPRRIEEIEATASGAADDVVALAARATVALERSEMTLRTLQSGEVHVSKIVAELEAAAAARTQAQALAAEMAEMLATARVERDAAREALRDIERLRGELRVRTSQGIGDRATVADPRQDPENLVRGVVSELRPLIERAVRQPARPDQIERLRAVMLQIAEAELPSDIERLRSDAYALLREVGVIDAAAPVA